MDTYLLFGVFEHNEKELAYRREVIYNTNKKFMSEYHTEIVADITNDTGNNLTGIICTHLSNTTSNDKTLGIMEISLEQKLPLFLGSIAIKSYTAIHLIHHTKEKNEIQLISCKKKGIGSSLEGEYTGYCYTLPPAYQEIFSEDNYDIKKVIEGAINIANKQSSKNKRYASFTVELYPKKKNNSWDNVYLEDDDELE